eukprot:TRINITY_DN6253_c0_g1_i4.p1 TRINITY_DN6253_c0_g1~~TRINITY_DN6253_c0_g1_i4.p1  ORF type:complete len:670 (-),score=115.96 TRINITY_DN6253_c0_g1_i4:28-1905(-)
MCAVPFTLWYAWSRPPPTTGIPFITAAKAASLNCSAMHASWDNFSQCLKDKNSFFLDNTKDLPEEVQANRQLFETFLASNQRDYYDLLNASEYRSRFLIFNQTLQKIAERNALELSKPNATRAMHGITKYADWSPDEFTALLGFQAKNATSQAAFGRRLFTPDDVFPDGSLPPPTPTPPGLAPTPAAPLPTPASTAAGLAPTPAAPSPTPASTAAGLAPTPAAPSPTTASTAAGLAPTPAAPSPTTASTAAGLAPTPVAPSPTTASTAAGLAPTPAAPSPTTASTVPTPASTVAGPAPATPSPPASTATSGFAPDGLAPAASVPSTTSIPGSAPCSKSWIFGEVRNQGKCGDCWTYSASETIRAAYIQQYGTDPGILSTQFIVDCMTKTTCKGGKNGCCGGNTEAAMRWIASQGGLPTAEAYGDVVNITGGGQVTEKISSAAAGLSYSGNDPTKAFSCKQDVPKAVTLSGSSPLGNSEDAMAQHVCSTGWISIAVDATVWQTYTGGVLSAASCGTQTNHAVTLIGLNQTSNAWIVQNSWGADWGVTVNGTSAPTDTYSNCALLAGPNKSGCPEKLQGGQTVQDACQVSCGPPDLPTGGFVYLQYGQNTCGIMSEPVIVSGTSAVR